jgi:hypothetical protein
LPAAAEIDRRFAAHRQPDNTIDLVAIADAAQVSTPGRLLGITHEIPPSDVVMVSKFAAPQMGEIGFRAIGAGPIDAEAVLVVDPLHSKAGMQHVLGWAFISMHHSTLGNPQTDCCHAICLGREHLRQRAAAALAHRHDNLAFARTGCPKSPRNRRDRPCSASAADRPSGGNRSRSAAAVGTDRLAVGLRPAQAQEHVFRAAIGHPHHLARVQRTAAADNKKC